MRILLLAATGLLFVACESTRSEPTNPVKTQPEKSTPEPEGDNPTAIVRATNRNVSAHEELRLQGKLQQMRAMHNAIADAVDREFDIFREMALEADTSTMRNMATKCLGFAMQKRREARDTLLVLCAARDVVIVANAVRGLGILLDKDTDLTPVIALLGSGNINIRTNAAWALRGLFRVKQTPRALTPQYHSAIERLVTMLHDKASTRSRRAAAWALANMNHPQTLEHLVSALDDDDEAVQIGGLRGLELLGDQRALEPVLEYLGSSPGSAGSSYAQLTLSAIVVQAGLAKTKAELKELGDSARRWRQFIAAARMK